MKDAEEVKVHDVAPVPEVTKSVAVPVEEETLAPANPEPVDAEPSVVEPVEVDTTSVDENVGPVAGHGDPYASSLKADLRNDEPTPPEGFLSLILSLTASLMSHRVCSRGEGGDRGRVCPRSPVG